MSNTIFNQLGPVVDHDVVVDSECERFEVFFLARSDRSIDLLIPDRSVVRSQADTLAVPVDSSSVRSLWVRRTIDVVTKVVNFVNGTLWIGFLRARTSKWSQE